MTDRESVDNNKFAEAELVKDISPGLAFSIASLTAFDDKLIFRTSDGVNGIELWVSDGTSSGTQLVKDINPGSDSAFASKGIPPRSFTIFDNKLFFSASDGNNGESIWVSDGTNSGTKLFQEFSGYGFTLFNDRLVFSGRGSSGLEPYISDGTPEGTQLLKDINKGIWGNSFPTEYAVVNDKLFFSAEDQANGEGLWVSDGTNSGTRLVKDINPTDDNAFLTFLTGINDRLFFRADDGINGQELWVSDGTEDGTQLVKDINPGDDSSSPLYFTEYKDKVYFNAFDGENGSSLWVTDGTTDGTQLFKQLGFPYRLTVFNDKLFFIARDGNGTELWVSDGTEEGTQLFKDINPGSDSSFSYPSVPVPKPFTVSGNKMFFSADDGTNGEQIWLTDGTPEGTERLSDINPEQDVSNFDDLTVVDDKLFFVVNKNTAEEQLWKLDLDSSILVNKINGTVEDDILIGTPNDDEIFGDRGDDSVEYSGDLTDFTILGSVDSFTVSGSGIGTDTLIDIEFLKFDDGLIAVDDSLFV